MNDGHRGVRNVAFRRFGQHDQRLYLHGERQAPCQNARSLPGRAAKCGNFGGNDPTLCKGVSKGCNPGIQNQLISRIEPQPIRPVSKDVV